MAIQTTIPEVAVITVPLQEWNDAKEMLKTLCSKVAQLTDQEEKELLTPKDVCEKLKIGRTTFQRYVADGTLAVVSVNKKKGTKKYVQRSEIERYLNSTNQ